MASKASRRGVTSLVSLLPDYLSVSRGELGKGQPVKVRIGGEPVDLAQELANAMLQEIEAGEATGKGATLIIPVGPVDQFPILAAMLNERQISCARTCFINMDEYLTDDDRWIPEEHPLSFRGYMNRAFYNLLSPELAPPPENRAFPDPRSLPQIPELI